MIYSWGMPRPSLEALGGEGGGEGAPAGAQGTQDAH